MSLFSSAEAPTPVFDTSLAWNHEMVAGDDFLIVIVKSRQDNGFPDTNTPTYNGVGPSASEIVTVDSSTGIERSRAWVWLAEDLPGTPGVYEVEVTAGGNRFLGPNSIFLSGAEQAVPGGGQVDSQSTDTTTSTVTLSVDTEGSIVIDGAINNGTGASTPGSGQTVLQNEPTGSDPQTFVSSYKDDQLVGDIDMEWTRGSVGTRVAHVGVFIRPASGEPSAPEGHHFTIHRPVGV